MDVPQGHLPEDATVIDTKQLRLLNEIADLAELVQEGRGHKGGYQKGLTPAQELRDKLLTLRNYQSR